MVRSRRNRSRLAGLLGLLGLLAFPLAPAWGQSSDHYVVRQHVTSRAGETSTSASFVLTSTLGELAVGTSSSHATLLQSGFWSFAGTGSVPLVLAVSRNVSNQDHCDLEWSGNAPPYDVYVGDCPDVFDWFHASTSGSSLPNVTPPAQGLVCFNVVPTPTAPEPFPIGSPAAKER